MWVRRGEFATLYRTERGRIDRQAWVRGAVPLAALLALLTLGWSALAPFASRGPGERAFFDPLAIAANLYLVLYTFAAVLIAVSWVNLSAKRFRDRGRPSPVGLAGLFPLLALLAGSIHWLRPRAADIVPVWLVFAGDALALAALAWTVAECLDLLAVARET